MILSFGNWTLETAPEIGGALVAARFQGHDILRPTLPAPVDARDVSAFPMVPFVGRIADGTFTTNGRTIKLPHNMPPEPHAIHGHGWQSVWETTTASSLALVLEHQHDGAPGWPWPYKAAQAFTAQDATLSLELSLMNLGDTDMPAGLGWHPYFPRDGAEIEADVTAVWRSRDDSPNMTSPVAISDWNDLRTRRPVDDLSIDHCFSAGSGGVHLTWPERRLSLRIASSSIFGHLTAYIPAGQDFFCIEPVSHAPNAVNSTLDPAVTGLRMIGPGETLSGVISISVTQN